VASEKLLDTPGAFDNADPHSPRLNSDWCRQTGDTSIADFEGLRAPVSSVPFNPLAGIPHAGADSGPIP